MRLKTFARWGLLYLDSDAGSYAFAFSLLSAAAKEPCPCEETESLQWNIKFILRPLHCLGGSKTRMYLDIEADITPRLCMHSSGALYCFP